MKMENTKYPKIQSIFKRTEKGIIMPDCFTTPEFKYLKDLKWECTEKIDGTNIRVIWENNTLRFRGRTDKAEIPVPLLDKLKELFNPNMFPIDKDFVLYGEGYGANIQRGGNYIKNGVDFILFDVRIGDYWLDRVKCEQIALTMGIKIVPFKGYFTIPQALFCVKEGFNSAIAENEDYIAEGLVLKTPGGLKDRHGNRIIAKIKHVDFVKLERQQINKIKS